MQELGRQAFRQRFEHGVDVGALGQHLARPFHFHQAQRFAVFMQMLDDGHHGAVVDPAHERLLARLDDGLGLRHGRLPAFQARLHDLAQVVDRVQEDVVQAAHFRFDVARHGQVDHEHGFVAARLDGALDQAQAQQR